jgi:hypothetical protein
MRRVTLNAAVVFLVVATLFGSGLTMDWGLNYGLGRYPGSTRPVGAGLRLPIITNGTVHLGSTFYTPDDIARVTGWYMRRYGVEPGPGTYTDGQCVKWSQTTARYMFYFATAATLCSAGHGTQIHISQFIALAPLASTGDR